MTTHSDIALYPRHLDARLSESLLDTPVVLVNGPRQCGKTTLVQQHQSGMAYFTLDDPGLLAGLCCSKAERQSAPCLISAKL
ncbi:MAG: AAA family ATPase [Rhodoferax sp.]